MGASPKIRTTSMRKQLMQSKRISGVWKKSVVHASGWNWRKYCKAIFALKFWQNWLNAELAHILVSTFKTITKAGDMCNSDSYSNESYDWWFYSVVLVGLPKKIQINDLLRLKNSLEARFEGVPIDPITILVSILNTREDAISLHSRLKLSANERDLCLFLTQHKQQTENIDELMWVWPPQSQRHSWPHVTKLSQCYRIVDKYLFTDIIRKSFWHLRIVH